MTDLKVLQEGDYFKAYPWPTEHFMNEWNQDSNQNEIYYSDVILTVDEPGYFLFSDDKITELK